VSQEFVGAGWGFPLRMGPSGDVVLVSREREVEEAIRLILGTAPFERPMRPEFGCGIHDFVFESADKTTLVRIAHEVRISLERWEPRVEIIDVVARTHDSMQEVLYIEVSYSIKGSNDPRNLVFPFYVIPQEEPGETTDEGARP
jgi:phage baseplate assembly protein W